MKEKNAVGALRRCAGLSASSFLLATVAGIITSYRKPINRIFASLPAGRQVSLTQFHL